jgi:hypothetical protein
MKIQLCYFKCDRAGCDHKSPPEPTFTEARKSADATGWFIRPSDTQPEHVCSECIQLTLSSLSAPEKAAP